MDDTRELPDLDVTAPLFSDPGGCFDPIEAAMHQSVFSTLVRADDRLGVQTTVPDQIADLVPTTLCPAQELGAAVAAAVPPVPSDPARGGGRPISLSDAAGVGPVMCIRLQHLGYGSVEELAHADPETLRRKLGTISRLLDIEGWIARARNSLRAGAIPGNKEG